MLRAIVSGSCGLVGYSACRRLLSEGWEVLGIDNDSRAKFFGPEASTAKLHAELSKFLHYDHAAANVADANSLKQDDWSRCDLVIHCAAQPSHDWAATHIRQDFEINAIGTLNVLEQWRINCPKAPFIHVSTSKVYGDNPNRLPLEEFDTRYDVEQNHEYWHGIPEWFSVDHCLHSFFGVSKLSGDLLAQEYGKNFGLPVGIFRPGCITGGHHQGAELHGFLSYMAKCLAAGKTYRIFGYGGKQVRCNIHADDLVDAFLKFADKPRPGEVYNMGGRGLDCSLMEARTELEHRAGKALEVQYVDKARTGDHLWWISDARKFGNHYDWKPKRMLPSILDELWEAVK